MGMTSLVLKMIEYGVRQLHMRKSPLQVKTSLKKSLQPYLQLIRADQLKNLTPIILTAAPSFWGLTLAANFLDYKLLSDVALFSVGAFSMRSFGCIINDIWDSDIDSKVERTKKRPIAART